MVLPIDDDEALLPHRLVAGFTLMLFFLVFFMYGCRPS